MDFEVLAGQLVSHFTLLQDDLSAVIGITTPNVKNYKGKARSALARALFFNRQGDLRDRNFENQRYRASSLKLVVAAITLWNTVYLERAVSALREHGIATDDESLAHCHPSDENISI